MSALLTLLVIRSPDIETLKAFYEKIGLIFRQEQHKKGPPHYSSLIGETVFEIYPLYQGETADKTRLGFKVNNLDGVVARLIAYDYRVLSPPKHTDYGYCSIVKDPDGRTVELYQK